MSERASVELLGFQFNLRFERMLFQTENQMPENQSKIEAYPIRAEVVETLIQRLARRKYEWLEIGHSLKHDKKDTL